MKTNTILRNIAVFTLCLGFCVIILGAFTRLVDAGLGCPDWPGCYGHLMWPETTEEIAHAENIWVDSPVETDKTWPEMIHRYLATSLGFMSLVILFFSIKYREEKNVTVTLPIMLVCAVILQGMFGMWTVTLKLWPQVVTVHLLGGFTVLSIIWLIVLSISKNAISQETKIFNLLQREKKWVYLATAVVIIQIAIGGWTTSNYAAVACPDFPTCQGEWWPPMDFESGFNFIQKIGPNYLGGQLHNSARVAIHMLHRIWAIVTVISLILMGLRLLQLNISPIRSKVFAVWGVLFVQVILGVSNIVFNFPIGVAVAHNAIAALLIMKLLSLLFFMSVSSHEYNKSV